MKSLAAALLLVALVACKNDPGGGQLTGTSSPEAEARRATEQDTQVNPAATESALTGTFGGPTSGQAPGQPAESGYHQGATGTDATTLTDPNVSTTAAPTQTTT
ncbi:MAG TPA: hypothetical protein VF846_22325 [Thermoanaerobaculia bacterium]|jgi:hypothetical protein